MGIAEVLATFPGIVYAVVVDGQLEEGEADLVRNQVVVAKVRIKDLRGPYNKPAKVVDIGTTCTFTVTGYRVMDGDHLLLFEKDAMLFVA